MSQALLMLAKEENKNKYNMGGYKPITRPKSIRTSDPFSKDYSKIVRNSIKPIETYKFYFKL